MVKQYKEVIKMIEKKLRELIQYLQNNNMYNIDYVFTTINGVECLKIQPDFSYSLSVDYIEKHNLIIYWSKDFKYEVHNPYTKIFINKLTKSNVYKIISGFNVDSIINYKNK